jgi:hypothetical protein
MLGIELVDGATGEPNTGAAAVVQRGAIERGLIVELGGRGDCVVRLMPPLNVSRETLDQAFEILGSVLAETTADVSRHGPFRLRQPVRGRATDEIGPDPLRAGRGPGRSQVV